jgi:hypothetical protein
MRTLKGSVVVACSLAVLAACPADEQDGGEEGEGEGEGGGNSGPPPFEIIDAGPRDDDDPDDDPDGGPNDDVDAGPTVACAEDEDEPNDTPATATTLPPGAPRLARFCGGNDDWYAVDVDAADCAVAVAVAVDEADVADGADLDLLLVDADGAVVGSAATLGPREALNVRTSAAGQYGVRVRGGVGADVGYTITAAVTCGSDQVCPADDAAEDNDDAASAASLDLGVPVDAAVCGTDRDFWQVPTTPGCFADIVATFDDDRGDVDLFLVQRTGGTEIQNSPGTGDREQITRVLASPDDVVLRVDLFNGGAANAGNGYRLRIDEICAADLGCPGDDPNEDNDTRGDARSLGREDATLGIVCGNDEDFFSVVPKAGCTTTFRVSFVDADGDIDIVLLDESSGATLSSSRTRGNEEVVTFAATNANPVVLQVFGFGDAQNDYRVTTTTVPTPPSTAAASSCR